MTPRHFLSVQSYSNWLADQANGFLLLGISEHKREFAETVCRGDYIVTYVKDKGFADVRCVTGDTVVQFGNTAAYDEAFPYALETKPIASLHSSRHIPADILAERLTFTGKHTHWKHPVGHSLRLITQEDGLLLVSLVVATGKADRITLNPRRTSFIVSERLAYA